jgi:hypothetical protein
MEENIQGNKRGNPACLKIVSIFSNYEREKHN